LVKRYKSRHKETASSEHGGFFVRSSAIVFRVLSLGLLYLLILENNPLPNGMERVSINSAFVWTYGIIAITLVGILKYLIR
tara:strand:- start:895 stop:1137 length:243 start_codon:yes stop_codon:yes gene_type:complete